MFRRLPFYSICILIAALCACKKKDATGPQGPTGAAGGTGYYGAISGYVSLYDEFGSEIFHGRDSIKVSLNDNRTTVTDNRGRYFFDSVPSGNYNVKISADSYGNTQTGNFAFLKDTIYKDLKMSHKPAINFIALNVKRSVGFPDFLWVFRSDSSAIPVSYMLFIGKTPQVSSSNYLARYIFIAYKTKTTVRIQEEDYHSAGIFYGDTVYYAAYTCPAVDYSAYKDDKTGAMVYTALGTPVFDTLAAP